MIDIYKIKMMPGQEPYTKEELDRLYKFVGEAAAAEVTEDDKLIMEWKEELCECGK